MAFEDIFATYTPSPRQEAFHADPRPRRWYCAGYGSGKTTASVWEAFCNAIIHHPGYTGIVCAPTFPLLWQGWVAEWKRQIPSACYRIREGSDARIWVYGPGGQVSEILLRSTLNAASLEAVNAAWAVFDEATRERDPEPYRVLLGRLRRGNPGHQRGLVLTGPPMTRRHWTATEFGAGTDATHEGDAMAWHDALQAVIRARTRDNPHLPESYEREIRARSGATKAWCAQWLDAMFGSIEGQVYEAFSRDVHVLPHASLVGRVWRSVICPVDWGWSNPGAMLVLCEDGHGDLYVTHEEYHRGKTVTDTPDGWVPIGVRLVKEHRVKSFHCDPSSPGHMETLARGLRVAKVSRLVLPADNDTGEGIRRVSARLEWAAAREDPLVIGRPALYVSDRCHNTIAEFEGYARRRERDGAISEAPEKRNDHAMDALRYGAMAFAA